MPAREVDVKVVAVLEPILELAAVHGVSRIDELDGAWEIAIDEHWYLAVNGHEERVFVDPPDRMGVTIPPFNFCLWYDCWLAALFHPYGGQIVAAPEVSEEIFVEAVRQHIRDLTGSEPSPLPALEETEDDVDQADAMDGHDPSNRYRKLLKREAYEHALAIARAAGDLEDPKVTYRIRRMCIRTFRLTKDDTDDVTEKALRIIKDRMMEANSEHHTG